ncbi:MAG TPA: sugar ABC transporter ATP-binding protein, partial [Candidatus Paenibacillus intestinavium]|nr:sugar ABC transporter ATP-binding protein [Candidatus Paenibacillus intestinavium]
MGENQLILTMTGIYKGFPGVKALDNVNLQLFAGEIHALMGENGAGKSTLIKVLTGVYTIDDGIIELEGQPIAVHSPLESQEVGISTVYQEVNLCPNLTVAENIFIGREPRKLGRILWKEMNEKAKKLLQERLHLDIDVTLPLHNYSVAIQQLVSIARALNISAKVLILDEPTSSLDRNEVKQLFNIMKKLKEEGMAILFVTHFLDQVYEVSDRITILRNGQLVGEYLTTELPQFDLVSKMIGKTLQAFEEMPKSRAQKKHERWFAEAEQLGRTGVIEPFNLNIGYGEVVGLAGLLGSGRTEVARLFFGADRPDHGTLHYEGKKSIHSQRQALENSIAFCSENRKAEGIIEDLTIRENIILALQASKGWFNRIPRKRQNAIADEYITMLNINP